MTHPVSSAPEWATIQVETLRIADRAAARFAERFTLPDGSLDFRGTLDDSRDGGDDFLEPFAQWPLLAILTGSERILELATKHFEGISRQLDALGYTKNGVDLGTDWFHQGEGNEFLYHLAVARRGSWKESIKYARPLLDADRGNYDQSLKIIRAPHPGVEGPRSGYKNGPAAVEWASGMRRYGLPLEDLAGIRAYDDLLEPDAAQTLGEAMKHRFGEGDVVMNLSATGLAFNAWLHTGDDTIRAWVLDYTEAWIERAQSNGGVVPDNVGLSGGVGELHKGNWWGGLYGWFWPHGAHSVLNAVAVASIASFQMTGDERYLDFVRQQYDLALSRGSRQRLRDASGALATEYLSRFDSDEIDEMAWTFPHRHSRDGWFDHLPAELTIPTAIWQLTGEAKDWERIAFLKSESTYDWNRVRASRLKEDSGHEEPWLQFLSGLNPDYPMTSMTTARTVINQRLAMVEADGAQDAKDDIHHWQRLNPLTTEAFLQVRLGAPSPLYYGGHLQASVVIGRDVGGLEEVSSVVTSLSREEVALSISNSGERDATLTVRAGTFGEHIIVNANGDRWSTADGIAAGVVPPGGVANLRLTIERNARTPRLS